MFTSPFLSTQDIARLDQCQAMARDAEKHGTFKCAEGGEVVFYLEYHRALTPGHVYSQSGYNEVHITKICEWHFDALMATEEDLDKEHAPYQAPENGGEKK